MLLELIKRYMEPNDFIDMSKVGIRDRLAVCKQAELQIAEITTLCNKLEGEMSKYLYDPNWAFSKTMPQSAIDQIRLKFKVANEHYVQCKSRLKQWEIVRDAYCHLG